MNILLTGSSGFVGNELRKYLIRKGYSVTGTVYSKKPRRGEVILDISDRTAFRNLRKNRFDLIIHSAALIDGAHRKNIRKVNVDGTKNIINYAGETGCSHFIHISSTGVYGFRSMGEQILETTPRTGIGTTYTWTKRKSERIIEKSYLDYTILRLPVIVGKGDTYLTPAVMRSLLNGKPFYMNQIKKRISLLYVKNISCIIEAIINAGPQRDSFHCTDSEMYWPELLNEYEKHAGFIPKKITRPFIPALLSSLHDRDTLLTCLLGETGMHFDNTKLMNVINIKHFPFNWKEGVKEAVGTYVKKQGNEYTDPSISLAVIQKLV